MVYPCYAGTISGVLNPEGTVSLCEVQWEIGNIRDFGYSFKKAWFSEKAVAMRRRIANRECWCTHSCFMTSSLPFSVNSGRGVVSSAGKVRSGLTVVRETKATSCMTDRPDGGAVRKNPPPAKLGRRLDPLDAGDAARVFSDVATRPRRACLGKRARRRRPGPRGRALARSSTWMSTAWV